MEAIRILLSGFMFGLSIAAPIGPIGLLCIQRSLTHGFWFGLAGGIGTAAADGLYAVVSSLGFSVFSGYVIAHQGSLRFLGGVLLCFICAKGLFTRPLPAANTLQAGGAGMLRSFAVTFLLTLSNPMTILTFVALTATLGAAGLSACLMLSLGIFAGSVSWWCILSGLVHAVRGKIGQKHYSLIHYASYTFLLLFSLYYVFSAQSAGG